MLVRFDSTHRQVSHLHVIQVKRDQRHVGLTLVRVDRLIFTLGRCCSHRSRFIVHLVAIDIDIDVVFFFFFNVAFSALQT